MFIYRYDYEVVIISNSRGQIMEPFIKRFILNKCFIILYSNVVQLKLRNFLYEGRLEILVLQGG